MSPRTPKTVLMEKAIENPNQILVATEVNGSINVECFIKDPAGSLLMFHILQTKLNEAIGKIIIQNSTQNSDQGTT